MVLYKVHSEFQVERFYSTVCSRATLFQIIVYSLMIIPPFFIAYATNELWQYTSSYREQPRVDYLNRLIVQISDKQSYNGSSVWSSFYNLDQLLQTEELATPTIKSTESDNNRDGKKDVLNLSIQFAGLNHQVHTVKLLLFFRVEFSLFSLVTFQSVVYISSSWVAPASRLWVGGELGLHQRVPFPPSGRLERYNVSVLNASQVTAEEFEFRNILSRHNQRNATVTVESPYLVWESGNSGNFTLDVQLQYPPMTVTYYPGFWQLIKFAWIQYLAILVVFWWVLSYVQAFVFKNQIILTIRKRMDKLHKH